MKSKPRLLPALLVSLFAGPVSAAQFSNVIVFGDSLSDAGYYRPFLASLGIPAQEVATLGRFTTNPGPVWSELVTTFYGHTPAASNAGGLIFAQGGATVASPSPSTPPGLAQRPVSTQINEYLSATNGAADPNALYGVWIGANDIFNNLGAFQAGAIDQAGLQKNVLGAATAEIQQIGRLKAAGARNILVFGLPNIGATPAFAGSAAVSGAVTQLSAGYNTTLWSGLASAGIRAIPVDTFSLLNEVGQNPSAFGFTNVTGLACAPFPPFTTAATISSQFCDSNHLVAPNADQTFLFADSVHPTTAAQKIIAQFAESLIEGPTQYSLLAETPLRTRANQVRTINDGVLQGRDAPVGKFTVFANGNGSKFDISAGGGTGGVNNDLSSFGVGVMVRATEAFTFGLAYGQDKADGTFGLNAGDYRTRENAFTLFAKAYWQGFYGSGIFTVSNIDFKDIHRNITLGPMVRTAQASTDGSNGSAFFDAGYDFRWGQLAVGPVVAAAIQNVTVNAFDENGAGSADLHIAQQTRKSEVWSFGVHAAYTINGWTPWLRVTADHENRNDDRFVTAMPISLTATGNSFDIPAFRPDSSFVTSAIGVNGTVAQRIGLGIAYFNVSGRSGIKEDGVFGTVSYRF